MKLPRSLLPSLAALQAFEASARHLSFTRAAEELNLSQGAISRQIATLETQLGVALFSRFRQRISLTPAGISYADDIRDALNRLSTATVNAVAFKGAGGPLALAILPTFGTRWLIPRLPDFSHKHPEVTINFSTRILPFDFSREPLDAAIHFGDPVWPGALMHRLMGETIVPVASPALIKRLTIKGPADLLRAPLLKQATRPHAWSEWLTAQELDPKDSVPGPSFEQFAMVAQAAIAGLGVAIVPRFLVEDEISSGTLVIPIDRPIESKQAYWLVYPEDKKDRPAVNAFRSWLLDQCRL